MRRGVEWRGFLVLDGVFSGISYESRAMLLWDLAGLGFEQALVLELVPLRDISREVSRGRYSSGRCWAVSGSGCTIFRSH